MGISLSGNLGVLPPPLWGRAGEGGRSFGQRSRGKLRPPPQPLPTGGRGAHRVCGAVRHQAEIDTAESALIFAARITAPQRAVSSLMKARIASGVPPIGVMLMARKCSAVSGACSTSLMARLSLATIAAGVFAGAASAFQVSERKPLTPASSMVGTSGTEATRAAVVTASIFAFFAWY